MKLIKLFISAGLFIFAGSSFAQPVSQTDLQRAITRATLPAQAQVNITFSWEKVIYARDVMRRPARMGAGKTVIGADKQTTSCKGILTQGNEVITPAVCAENGKFALKKINLKLANGKTVSYLANALRVKEDVAYIRLSKEDTHGLTGILTAPIKQGQSLSGFIGENALVQFFRSNGVPAKARRPGMGRQTRSNLKIGDALFANGRVVALVKKVPHHYRTLLGGLAEEAFAVIR